MTPMALAHAVHPIKTGLGISSNTCVQDKVFPPDDLSSDPETQAMSIFVG